MHRRPSITRSVAVAVILSAAIVCSGASSSQQPKAPPAKAKAPAAAPKIVRGSLADLVAIQLLVNSIENAAIGKCLDSPTATTLDPIENILVQAHKAISGPRPTSPSQCMWQCPPSVCDPMCDAYAAVTYDVMPPPRQGGVTLDVATARVHWLTNAIANAAMLRLATGASFADIKAPLRTALANITQVSTGR